MKCSPRAFRGTSRRTRSRPRCRNGGSAATCSDLTESNPTRVGLPYPVEALPRAERARDPARYEPAPLGLPARGPRSRGLRVRGAAVDPARVAHHRQLQRIVLVPVQAALRPGDAVLIPEPSYPLYDYLVRLEGAVPIGYRLAFDGVWSIDFASIEQALADARARGAPRARSSSSARTIRPAASSNATSCAAARSRRARTAVDRPTRCSRLPRSRPIRPGVEPPRSTRRGRPPRASSAWAGCRSRAACRT
jgi:hypothetical protein